MTKGFVGSYAAAMGSVGVAVNCTMEFTPTTFQAFLTVRHTNVLCVTNRCRFASDISVTECENVNARIFRPINRVSVVPTEPLAEKKSRNLYVPHDP